MTVKSRSVINAEAVANIQDNTAQEITPADVRQRILDLADSSLNPSDDKDASGKYAGLTLFKINFKNALGSIISFFANANTVARTYTFPDKDLTVAGLVDIQGGAVLYAVASGTDTYTAALTPALTSYVAGQLFKVKFTNACTGASTLNIDGLGAIALKKAVSTALASGDIAAGAVLLLLYDGTNFQVVGIAAAGSSGITIGTTPISGGVPGRILFEKSDNTVNEDANLFWDIANSRLGIGTPSPITALDVNGVLTLRTAQIFTDTVNGSDNKELALSSADAIGVDRGAFFALEGNEVASIGGSILFGAGDVSSGKISFFTGKYLERLVILATGNIGVRSPAPASVLSIKGSISTKILSVGGKDKEFYLDSGNLIATGETDLYVRTFEASLFGANGDTAYFSFTAEIVGAGVPTKRLRLYFAGTNVYDSTALAFAAGDVVIISGQVIRVSSSVVRVTVTAQLNTAVAITKTAYTEVAGLTLSATNIFKLTGESAGVGSNNNDIVAKMGFIRFEEVSQ